MFCVTYNFPPVCNNFGHTEKKKFRGHEDFVEYLTVIQGNLSGYQSAEHSQVSVLFEKVISFDCNKIYFKINLSKVLSLSLKLKIYLKISSLRDLIITCLLVTLFMNIFKSIQYQFKTFSDNKFLHKITHETMNYNFPPLLANYQKASCFSMIVCNSDLISRTRIST